jgi:isopentenyl phosphate kinase
VCIAYRGYIASGSFGHFQAHQYDLRSGGGKDWLLGLSKTRESVTKLNHLVTSAHTNVGLPAVAVSLFPVTNCHNKELTNPGALSHIHSLVDRGFIPVIHGDVVLDSQMKCTVYGGDSILKWSVSIFPYITQHKISYLMVPGW